jgi:Tol biopolymer transport system component
MRTGLLLLLTGLVLGASASRAADPAPAIDLVSLPSFNLPPLSTANGNSLAPRLTPDGRFVVFLSEATDLLPGLVGPPHPNLFRRERTNGNGALTLLSVDVAGVRGANDHCGDFAVTLDGRFVAFASPASNLVPNDTNGVSDVFVRDVVLGQTVLVSVRVSGAVPGRGASRDPAISADGRFVAFVSEADDLVANDTNGTAGVFIRDLGAGTTTRVTSSSGPPLLGQRILGGPQITPDGRYVAFASTGSNLVAGVTNTAGDVYRYDRVTGVTTCVSTNAAQAFAQAIGLKPGGLPTSWHPSLSDDGQVVTFLTSAQPPQPTPNRVPLTLILRRDLSSDALVAVATNVFAFPPPDAESPACVVSSAGRYIAYAQAGPGAQAAQLYRWDASSSAVVLVSVGSDGQAPASATCRSPTMSVDGRYVAFLSRATNLVATAVNGDYQVYVRDLDNSVTRLISVDLDGVGSGSVDPASLSVSDDGRWVAWSDRGNRLVSEDRNEVDDVFVRDLLEGRTEAISATTAPSRLPGGLTWMPRDPISADGTRLVFTSFAGNLTPDDTNHASDVFVRDLVTRTTLVVSVSSSGNATGNGASLSPALSADGHHVAFVSRASDLGGNDTNAVEDVFVRHLDTGMTELVSVGTNGLSSGSGRSSAPSISADGRWVAFQSAAPDLTPDDTDPRYEDVFVRDLVAGQTRMITAGLFSERYMQPVISADGRFTTFQAQGNTAQTRLLVYDAADRSVSTVATNVDRPVLSADSRTLVASTSATNGVGESLLWYDLQARTSHLAQVPSRLPAAPASDMNPVVSRDARWVAFESRAAIPVVGTNGETHVLLWDSASDNLWRVSADDAGSGAVKTESGSASLGADGRLLLYRTLASDPDPAGANRRSEVVAFDRSTGLNMLLSHAGGGPTPARGFSLAPAASPDGGFGIFTSTAGDLTADGQPLGTALFRATWPTGTPTDTDGDGLDDDWERTWFTDLSRDGNGDWDGDGFPDRAEYLTGTDPTDPRSALRILIQPVAAGGYLLSWPAGAGQVYGLEHRDDLLGSWQRLLGPVFRAGTTAEATDAGGAPQVQRYYRVRGETP